MTLYMVLPVVINSFEIRKETSNNHYNNALFTFESHQPTAVFHSGDLMMVPTSIKDTQDIFEEIGKQKELKDNGQKVAPSEQLSG